MLSLKKRIENADRIQEFWNEVLTEQQRRKLADENETFCSKLFRQAGCETMCTECLGIMETSTTPIKCILCGGNTVSPYYC